MLCLEFNIGSTYAQLNLICSNYERSGKENDNSIE